MRPSHQYLPRAGFASWAVLATAWLIWGGCARPLTPGTLVLTQTPQSNATSSQPADVLDLRYPAGSRVVLSEPSFDQAPRILSAGLSAAGGAVIAYDGKRVVFAGKARAGSDWQIYESRLDSGTLRAVTAQAGGAMEPALLPDGSVAFVSPVPRPDATTTPPVLYVTSPDGKARRLTFSSRPVRGPTLLSDGRILFISEEASARPGAPVRPMLYTINNDGTEITAFAAPPEQATAIERPRQLPDGRVVFVVRADEQVGGSAEYVRLARPFNGSEPLLADAKVRVLSVQPAGGGELLVCARNSGAAAAPWAAFRIKAGANSLDTVLPCPSGWGDVEAIPAAPATRPRGRISTMDPASKTGQILCLNANFTGYQAGAPEAAPASRIRVLVGEKGKDRLIGEVGLQADGSFMAEIPADVPLGLEAVDDNGHVVRRLPPMVWVRPGENRICVGCHAPPHHSPQNHRPLAVEFPTPNLCREAPGVAKK